MADESSAFDSEDAAWATYARHVAPGEVAIYERARRSAQRRMPDLGLSRTQY